MMTDDRARQILSSLLTEKGVAPPEGSDIRQLLALTLSTGNLPDDISHALAETFNAVAAATQPPASEQKNADPDGTSSNA